TPEQARIIDGSGLTLLPGVIDSQVHFRSPGLEHKEDLFTASCACARGGVTSFLEMPNTLPPTTAQADLTDKLAIAASKSLVNYGFFIGATAENLDDLRTVSSACGIAISMGSANGPLLVDTAETIEPIFASGDRLIVVHAEDQARIFARQELFAGETDPATHTQVQDSETALLATELALSFSKKYQRRLHILHLSTGDEAELLRRDKPSWVTAEVTPQHLLLDVSAYEKLGTLAQINPPLKYERDRDLLWQALLDGVIDFVTTDHAPHTLAEKGKGYPNAPAGMPGVETALPLMLTQSQQSRCSVAQVANWMSTAVARAYQIPNKGLIEPGYDADLVLVDLSTYRPVLRQELQTKCGWSPFEGWNLTGWPVITIVGGHVVYDYGKIDTTVRGSALTFE
ncbi:dihydroorotase, partial [cf. Phormidesmis sp. LEGE 11477]|uniref:dihydroorotase n=1 Tax=cf. Phormidesmis sp. LEGE 11477 TaxID=1828680 RepID=UPI00187E118F